MALNTASTTTAPPAPLNADHQLRLLEESQAACLQRIQNFPHPDTPNSNTEGAVCPAVWDGILCWDHAAPGQLLTQRCPAYVAGFHSQANASKLCTDTGQWHTREDNLTWTNFTQCFSGPQATVIVDIDLLPKNESYIEPYLPLLKLISEVGHTVSLLSLVVAFLILVSFKKLRCPRNVLHMHLFASFIMRAFMSLLKDSLFVQGLGMTPDLLTRDEGSYFNIEQQINWPCRTIISLWQYFIMANYSWILMEGLYLHNLIFLALFTDSSSITLYIAMGWGLPALFVFPWTLCRALLENTWCWTTNDITSVFLLIRVPTIASVVVNFVLFINIVRVLLSKLKSSISEEHKTYRKWAKSTLVLVPLFGVHYMIFLVLHMSTDNTVEIVWLFCDQLFASFNGFFVALLYCFLNGEVRSELSRKWNHFSCSEKLEKWNISRHENITEGIFKENNIFIGKDRDKPRRSRSYSGTCTTENEVPVNMCCNPTKKRSAPPPAQGIQPAYSPRAAGVARAALHGSYHSGQADVIQVPKLESKDPFGNV